MRNILVAAGLITLPLFFSAIDSEGLTGTEPLEKTPMPGIQSHTDPDSRKVYAKTALKSIIS
jgi:hypothetical protein